MLDTIVRYLRDSLIPFRLSSYPSMEHLPAAAHPLPPHGVLVETQLVLAGDRLVLACFPASEEVDFAALGNALGAQVTDAMLDDLPEALKREGQPPPLGQLFGIPLVLDEAVTQCGVLVFQPFGESDFFEITYDDFARQEQPRVASFVRKGELPAFERERAQVPTGR